MKKIILLALTTLMMVGCDVKLSDGTYEPYSYRTYIIDSCEYVGIAKGTSSDYLAHKGNCRFCKERRQKELEELVIRCKTPLEITHKDGVATDTVMIFKDKEK